MKISQWLAVPKASKLDRLDAELILLDVLKYDDRSKLSLYSEYEIEPAAMKTANKMVRRRLKKEPLAYILGYRDFYGRRFSVMDGNVKTLIPRPESEIIIDLAKEINPHTILDVGTGSGVLALTLAAEIPNSAVFATDIFPEYFSVFSKNAQSLGIPVVNLSEQSYAPQSTPTPVGFLVSSLLDNVNSHFDLIVANLPYVDGKWRWLDKKALSYEPASALFAADDGLGLIKQLIVQVKEKSASDYLIIEADPCQFSAITAFAMNRGLNLIQERGFQLLFRVG